MFTVQFLDIMISDFLNVMFFLIGRQMNDKIGTVQSAASIHVIPPSSSGRLQEMSRKIGKNSFKMYYSFNKNSNPP